MNKNIFITGTTGLLGSYLTKILLENNYKVYALARNKNNKSAKERVLELLKFWDEKVLAKVDNLIVLEGDITEENLGLDSKNMDLLKNEIEEIFHCAAETEFNKPIEYLRKINVEGTKRLLELILKFKRFNKLSYISTAFVCGKHKGEFRENDFDLGQVFNNNYEQSKFEAEALVRKYMTKNIKTLIFRPSILVGDYVYGKTIDFKMFYKPLRLFALEIIEKVPLDIKTYLNLMPVDLAAQAIYLLHNAIDESEVYHITSPTAFPIDHVVEVASTFFHFHKPKYITLKQYLNENYTFSVRKILDDYVAYFNFMAIFVSDKTQSVLLHKCNFKYPIFDDNFLKRLFNFAAKSSYIKKKK